MNSAAFASMRPTAPSRATACRCRWRRKWVVVVNIAGGGERVVARSTPGKNWFGLWDTGPSWSPDGRRIALCGGEHGPSGDRAVIFDVRLDEGTMATLPTPPWT